MSSLPPTIVPPDDDTSGCVRLTLPSDSGPPETLWLILMSPDAYEKGYVPRPRPVEHDADDPDWPPSF